MARTPSQMIPLGSPAPDFHLPDTVSGSMKQLKDLCGEKGTLTFFICNHCPFVQHVHQELVHIANDFQALGIGFIAISSNDAKAYPEDGPEQMKQVALDMKYPFPYLYDESQQIARAYQATCTPDFFLYDAGQKLVYRGQLDDSRPGNGIPVTGSDIRNALHALLAGATPSNAQKPSIGCNIKWKQEAFD